MTIPTYDELMSPVLKLLSDGVERSGEDITNTIADQLNLTEEERNRITVAAVTEDLTVLDLVFTQICRESLVQFL